MAQSDFFRPCRAVTLFFSLLAAVALSAALTLVQPLPLFSLAAATYFALTALWATWVLLLLLALLCWGWRWWQRLSTWAAGALFWLGLVLLTAAVGFGAYAMGLIDTPETMLRATGVAALLGMGAWWGFAAWRERLVFAQAAQTAQLAALAARIEPHFLLNTLNVISGLLPEEPQKAESALSHLSLLLHGALRDPTPWPLAAELEAVQAYLALAQLRYGARMALEWRVTLPEAVRSAPVPRWLFLPLVENAVVHGVAARRAPTTVVVAAAYQLGRLELCVGNPLAEAESPPEPATPLAPPLRPHGSGFGLGVSAVASRIAALGGTLTQERRNGWHWAVLTLPLEQREER